MYTARVPGLGLVEWTPQQVDDYARELIHTHRATWTWRSRSLGPLRWPVLVGDVCKRCGDDWPCSAAWWADRHQVQQERLAGVSWSR